MSTDQTDRVRAHTAAHINREIDEAALARIRTLAKGPVAVIDERIAMLEREWDIERWLEAHASTLAGLGTLLAALHTRRWLIVPAMVLPFLFQHAIKGWCPPVSLLRRAGVRTRREIDRELYALKALRGDFSSADSPERAWQAAGTTRRTTVVAVGAN